MTAIQFGDIKTLTSIQITNTKKENKNRNIASQEIAEIDHSSKVSCFHAESSTLCCMALTDSYTRPACHKVSFKKLYFLPPSYFLVNTD